MARYRVGNRFLSQEEYDSEFDWKLMVGLFLVGSIGTGFLLHQYVVNPHWHDSIRFIVTVLPSIAVGCILALLRTLILMLFIAIIAITIVAVIIRALIDVV